MLIAQTNSSPSLSSITFRLMLDHVFVVNPGRARHYCNLIYCVKRQRSFLLRNPSLISRANYAHINYN